MSERCVPYCDDINDALESIVTYKGAKDTPEVRQAKFDRWEAFVETSRFCDGPDTKLVSEEGGCWIRRFIGRKSFEATQVAQCTNPQREQIEQAYQQAINQQAA